MLCRVIGYKLLHSVDCEARRAAGPGFSRFVYNEGTEVEMREFFDRIRSDCVSAQLLKDGVGIIDSFDQLADLCSKWQSEHGPSRQELAELGAAISGIYMH